MRLAVSDHAEKSAAGVVVLAVLAQMAREFLDPLREEGDLNLWRAAVLCVNAGFLDYLGLLSCG